MQSLMDEKHNCMKNLLINGGGNLPVVIVEMWEGRTDEQKEKLIKGITKAFEEIGVPAEALNIIIHDVPKTNWGLRGGQASKLFP